MNHSYPIDGTGTWVEQRRLIPARGQILYCDRDGVIIHDKHYLSDPDGVVLIDGIIACLSAAERAAIPIVIVTNQSGIGRGYFGWDAFAAVQDRMMALLLAAGIQPAAVLASPHHPNAEPPYKHPDPPMRKPNPGMITTAAALFDTDPAASLMIGDKRDDMHAAANAGLRRGILVGSSIEDTLAVMLDTFTFDAIPNVRAAIPLVQSWAEG